MRADTIARAVAFALIVAGTSILAAPAADHAAAGPDDAGARLGPEPRPQRGRSRSTCATSTSTRRCEVQVINGEPQYRATNPVQVREVRAVWDYETITLGSRPTTWRRVLNAPRRRPAGRRPGSRS